MSNLQPESTLSTLCRGCGLCCDGSLFSHVGLEPDEALRLQTLGIATASRSNGAQVLLERCSALKVRDCQIYADRPRSCASYRCLLAAALAEKEISLEEAQQVVKKAHRLIAAGGARRFLRRQFRGRSGLD